MGFSFWKNYQREGNLKYERRFLSIQWRRQMKHIIKHFGINKSLSLPYIKSLTLKPFFRRIIDNLQTPSRRVNQSTKVNTGYVLKLHLRISLRALLWVLHEEQYRLHLIVATLQSHPLHCYLSASHQCLWVQIHSLHCHCRHWTVHDYSSPQLFLMMILLTEPSETIQVPEIIGSQNKLFRFAKMLPEKKSKYNKTNQLGLLLQGKIQIRSLIW